MTTLDMPALIVNPEPLTGMGARAMRVESYRFVRGAGSFVDDRHSEDMLHVAFVRSTVPHAMITSVSVNQAAALDGVHLVVTGVEAHRALQDVRGKWPLAHEKVRYVGEPVVAIVAESRYLAEDAAELVEIDYDLLPPLVEPLAALAEDAPQIFAKANRNLLYERKLETPAVDAAFASAAHVVELTTRSARAIAAPMEPRSYVAEWDAVGESLTLWTSSASAFGVRTEVARALQLPETQVRVVVEDVGGSFGSKIPTYPEEVVVSWLAQRLGAPVKYTETRVEHMQASVQGRDQVHKLRGAFDADGKILAIDDVILADMGANTGVDNSVDAAFNYVPGAYLVPEYRCWARAVATNKPPHGPLRGIGKADAAFAVERLMDHAARRVGLDRAEIRIRNFIPEKAFPYRTVTGALLDSGRYEDCLRKVMDVADYEGALRSKAEPLPDGVRRGVGISLVLEPTSASRRGPGMGFASCRLTVTPSGQVLVQSGTGQQGQAHQTTIGQIVAGCLGVKMSDVTVHLSDTQTSPYGFAAGSSRSTAVLMSAAYLAGERAADKLRRIAAHSWDLSPEWVTLADGTMTGPDGQRMPIAAAAHIAYGRVDELPDDMEPGFEILASFRNPHINYTPDDQGRFNGFSIYPYDACVAVVDVDTRTGSVVVRKYVSVHDCGPEINPVVVRTQHTGATVQGLGLALLEELPFDADGQPLAASFLDYLLPTVNDLPQEMRFDHIVTPSPFTPLGAKGAGETGTLSPPAALAGAIEDALSEWDVSITHMPFTPERILAALHPSE